MVGLYNTSPPISLILGSQLRKIQLTPLGRGRAEVAVPRCEFLNWFSTIKTGSGREV